MPGLIGLDFETYGGTDLPRHGLDRYVKCQFFQPLIASTYWWKDGNPRRQRFELWDNSQLIRDWLRETLGDRLIVAHNAGFENAVCDWLGFDLPPSRFIDSATMARALGAGGKLEAAAPQLLGIDKLESGSQLIKLFSIPGKYQEKNGSLRFDPDVIADHQSEWGQFGDYCDLDAELGFKIAWLNERQIPDKELRYDVITREMNRVGWPVDVEIVEEMQRRYLENQEQALHEFQQEQDAHDLNLNSLKQLKEWCAERGIKATSFDEKHVARLMVRIDKKLLDTTLPDDKRMAYEQVQHLLRTKQILGGSSLKKLATILDIVNEGRLKDQYVHVGAGQTWRTTGRSVQMQNLKRIGSEPDDMLELMDPETEWDNDQLARNIRQCFTASEENGFLLVGDFSSVESRGLAWFSGDLAKLEAFRQKLDIYKVGAAKQYGCTYEAVTKEQRQFGKVGELSCGYQAGPGAVQSFAAGMGVELTEAEATKIVFDWRQANPKEVRFWWNLDAMLRDILEQGVGGRRLDLLDGFRLEIWKHDTPTSLTKQHPRAQSIRVMVRGPDGQVFLVRYFHGCYVLGKEICYYKPSELKHGDLWKPTYVNPKTKQVERYKIYGGKLAGILTQSFCRELFMQCLLKVADWCRRTDGVEVIGQFHDEIVVDWQPSGSITRGAAEAELQVLMEDPGLASSFPLAAEIKHDFRYTK